MLVVWLYKAFSCKAMYVMRTDFCWSFALFTEGDKGDQGLKVRTGVFLDLVAVRMAVFQVLKIINMVVLH